MKVLWSICGALNSLMLAANRLALAIEVQNQLALQVKPKIRRDVQ